MKVKVGITGGFHNSAGCRVFVEEKIWKYYEEGGYSALDIYYSLSPSVRHKVMKTMCGKRGCMCPIHTWSIRKHQREESR